MQKIVVTRNYKATQQIGKLFSEELKGGEIICLSGNLGSGKTTFAQGMLEGLGAKGFFTSPTFVICKQYDLKLKNQNSKVKTSTQKSKIKKVYHIDAYRINSDDMINLQWAEITSDKNNVIIVEWAERIKKIIPMKAVWIKFEWIDKNERKITFKG